MSSSVGDVLARVQQKVENTSKRPWFEMGKKFRMYDERRRGTVSMPDLSKVLQGFRVQLPADHISALSSAYGLQDENDEICFEYGPFVADLQKDPRELRGLHTRTEAPGRFKNRTQKGAISTPGRGRIDPVSHEMKQSIHKVEQWKERQRSVSMSREEFDEQFKKEYDRNNDYPDDDQDDYQDDYAPRDDYEEPRSQRERAPVQEPSANLPRTKKASGQPKAAARRRPTGGTGINIPQSSVGGGGVAAVRQLRATGPKVPKVGGPGGLGGSKKVNLTRKGRGKKASSRPQSGMSASGRPIATPGGLVTARDVAAGRVTQTRFTTEGKLAVHATSLSGLSGPTLVETKANAGAAAETKKKVTHAGTRIFSN